MKFQEKISREIKVPVGGKIKDSLLFCHMNHPKIEIRTTVCNSAIKRNIT